MSEQDRTPLGGTEPETAAADKGPQSAPAAGTKANAKSKADAEAKAKAAAEAKADAEAKAKADAEAATKKPKRVRVICDGTLGPLLLATGEITSDPRYVALLDTPSGRRKVEAVK